MERSLFPRPSFVAFLDPNVSPYSQISPAGLGVSGVNVFLQIRLWIKLKPRNCFEYEKPILRFDSRRQGEGIGGLKMVEICQSSV